MNEDCLKLTAYFAERDRSGDRFLGDALLSVCARHGLATSVLLRGAEGFGRHRVLQTERLLSLSEDLPMVLAAVDSRTRVEAALPEIGAVAEHRVEFIEIGFDRVDGFFIARQFEQGRCITAGHSRNGRIFCSHRRALFAVKLARGKPSPTMRRLRSKPLEFKRDFDFRPAGDAGIVKIAALLT